MNQIVIFLCLNQLSAIMFWMNFYRLSMVCFNIYVVIVFYRFLENEYFLFMRVIIDVNCFFYFVYLYFVNFFNFFVLELSYREVENVYCVEKLQVSCKLICVYKNKYVYVSLFYGKIIKYYFLLDVNIKYEYIE